MTTNYSVIPSRTDGSLGRTKTEPTLAPALALDHQVAAAEWETAADWLRHLALVVGPDVAYSAGTLRYLLDRVGTGALGSHHWRDDFIACRGEVEPPLGCRPEWTVPGACDSPTFSTVDGGGVAKFALDAIVASGCGIAFTGSEYHAGQGLRLRARVRFTDVVNGSAVYLGMFNDLYTVSWADAWGITYNHADSTKFRLFTRKGGAWKYTDVGGALVAGTWYELDLRLELDPTTGWFAVKGSVAGGAEATEVQQEFDVTKLLRPTIHALAGAAAGDSFDVDVYDIRATDLHAAILAP